MKPNRRNLLAMGGGAAAGIIFTPAPWTLLNHSAKWTQNWSWIPQPARGPVDIKAARCGLCPHGCAMNVRLCAGYAVGVSPAGGETLCPLAFGAHQLNWHPRRVREVRHAGKPATWDEAKTALQKARAEGPVMVVDGRPGRAASRILAKAGGYAVAHGPEGRSLAPYAAWSGVPADTLGYDLENARTLVSFGAPLLDGWGGPGRFTKLWSAKAAGTGDPALRLIQIEPHLTRTASLAWRWAPVRQGGEAALAAGLARVLVDERLVPAKGPAPEMTVESAAGECGIPRDAIVELARMIAAQLPAMAISAGEQPAVAALNLLLGGTIVQRRGAAPATSQVKSPRAVVIDATVPWDYEAPAGAEVFRFAAWDGGGAAPDWLLPAPGFLEELTEHPSAPGSAAAAYAISPALMEAAPGVMNCAAFLGGDIEGAIRGRCEEIFRSRAGRLRRRGEAETVAVRSVESAAKLYDELAAGAVWTDDVEGSQKLRCERREWPQDTAATPRADWTAGWSAPVLPPLSAKLYQESNLREAPSRIRK